MAVAAEVDDARYAFAGTAQARGCAKLWEKQVGEQEGPKVVCEEGQVNHGVPRSLDGVAMHVADAGVIDEN